MDLLMPIIGCALGIVASIMSIKVVLDKGKKAITGAIANKAEQVLQSPAVQTALTAGMAVATGGASLGASAAASAATNGIRMASNVASTAASAQNAKAGANGKDKNGRFSRTKDAISGGAMATKGTAQMSAEIGKKVATDLANSKAGKAVGRGLGKAKYQVSRPVKFVGKKAYTLAENTKNAIGDSKFGQATKRAIKGVRNTGAKAYTSSKAALGKIRELPSKAAAKGHEAKDWFDNTKFGQYTQKTITGVKNTGSKVYTSSKATLGKIRELPSTMAAKGQEAKDWFDETKFGRFTNKSITGAKSLMETAKKYGNQLGDYARETAEFARGTEGNATRREGMKKIRKALTGSDLFLGTRHAKKGTMQNKENALMGEMAQSDTTDNNDSLKDRMIVKLNTAKGTTQRLANNARESLNRMREQAGASMGELGTVAAVGVGAGTVNGKTLAIPMQGDYRDGYNPELDGMGIPPMAQLVYNDFSVLQSSRYDRNGALMSQQAMANPRDTMNLYSSSNNNGNFSLNVNNISTVNGIGTTQHYEEAMQAMNEHFKERFGTIAYSEEEGRAMAQMLDRLQTQREVTTSNSIMNDVIYKEQPEQQKIDAITAEFQGNADAVKARQNYIESHTEAIVTGQTEGRSFSEDDMQKIREQAQKVVEQSTENRIINEEGFRNDIFGEEISSRLNKTFSQIDSDLERKINDAIAENRESLNATYASSHPDIPYKEIDSARITEDMQRDLEQMVTAQVNARSAQMESQVQSNAMESMQYNYGNASNLERQRLGTQTETQTSTRTGLQEDTYYTNDTRPQAAGNTYNQSYRRYSGSGRVNGGSARVSRRVNRGRNPEQPQVTGNLQGAQTKANNRIK